MRLALLVQARYASYLNATIVKKILQLLKKLFANFLGYGWSAVMGFALITCYVVGPVILLKPA
jgi:hypothetical protein